MTAAKRIAATALGGALYLAATATLFGSEHWQPIILKPLMAVSLDAGTKHVVSYFVPRDGACRLTLMIAEAPADGESSNVAPSRLQASIAAGRSAQFDASEGKAILFACKPGAESMSAIALDRLAAYSNGN